MIPATKVVEIDVNQAEATKADELVTKALEVLIQESLSDDPMDIALTGAMMAIVRQYSKLLAAQGQPVTARSLCVRLDQILHKNAQTFATAIKAKMAPPAGNA